MKGTGPGRPQGSGLTCYFYAPLLCFVQVPQLCDWKPTSLGKMVTVVVVSVGLGGSFSASVPSNPFNLAYWHPLPPVLLYVPGSMSVLTINMPSLKEVLLLVI